MNNTHRLASLHPSSWAAGQVVVFDWFDGPRQGVARMANPECEFAFELLAERHNPSGLDDRLFRVCELPPGSITKIMDAIRSLGSPANAVWVPVWKFNSEEKRLQADQEINRILSQQKDTGLVIYSRDMITFLGCWHVDRARGEIQDWFVTLGIP